MLSGLSNSNNTKNISLAKSDLKIHSQSKNGKNQRSFAFILPAKHSSIVNGRSLAAEHGRRGVESTTIGMSQCHSP